MDSSVFAFAIDVVGEGADALVATACDRAGVGGISLAAAYHNARDVLPHNPAATVYFHEGGTVFFRPEQDRYDELRPIPGALAAQRDPLGELCAAAERRGVDVRAWVVYLHNSRLGFSHPDLSPENALGDRLPTELCASQPAVRRYAAALTSDVCRYPIRSIMAEALHFRAIEHGYHHERYFLDLGPTARFLLGICFCTSCLETAAETGVDGSAARDAAASMLRGWIEAGSGGDQPVDRDEIATLGAGQMAGYLLSRERTITSLAEAVRGAAADRGVRLTFSAHGGSAKGGKTESSDSLATAWTLGVDVAAVARVVDEFEVLGYGTDTAMIDHSVTEYAAEIAAHASMAVALRPMWPDTTNPDDLADRVKVARDQGAKRVDFYHYGLMPVASMDWIRAALAEAASPSGDASP